MSIPPAYEFEEDEAPKKERKAFIPGLEPAIPPAVPSAAPVGSAGQADPARGPVQTPKTTPAAAPAPASETDDPELKPGSRKDLWACPHCETRNKPDRTTCRNCGKTPSDAPEPTIYTKPVFKMAIVGAVVLVVLLWLVTRPNLTFKPAGPATVDRSVRKGGAAGGARELVGKSFKPHGRLAVCGRICAVRSVPNIDGVTTVVLLLGSASADDQLEQANVSFNNQLIVAPPGSVVLNLITTEKINGVKGTWLSVVGDYGDLLEDGRSLGATIDGDLVAVDQLQQQ